MERFWSKATKGEGCWLWAAAVGNPPRGEPYGQFWWRRRMTPAHRVAWELTNGPIPAGMKVLHRCDATRCVRPDHLFLGTQADNIADMDAKGRRVVVRGTRHGRAALSEADIASIRERRRSGETVSSLARAMGVARKTISRAAVGVVLCALISCSPSVGSSDMKPRPPTPVAFPSAGGSFRDPDFGTAVYRLTDKSHGRRCVHAYSYWQPWNANQTRLLLACDDVPLLYSWDAQLGRARRLGELAVPIQFEGASWSKDFPSTIYALDERGPQLVRLNVDTGAVTVLRDFGAELAGLQLRQLSMSEGGGTAAFRAGGGAVAWSRADDHLFRFPLDDPVNEVQLEKGGAFAVVHLESGAAILWDYRRGRLEPLSLPTGHWDIGRTRMVNGDGVLTGVQVRDRVAPTFGRNVLQYRRPDGKLNWRIAEHTSLRSDSEAWIVVSTYAGDKTWAAFEDEIVLVRPDGSGFLRLAHTFSCECATSSAARYWTQPRATISRDGRWVLWTSDLGSATRTDVLVVRVP